MSFLEYVLRRYIGPPRGGYFKCPHCDRRNPSIVVNKPLAGCKIKWRCVAAGCPLRGRCQDEYDVVQLYTPHTRYPERRAIVSELRREYEAEHTDHSPDAPTFPPRGQQDRAREEWNRAREEYHAAMRRRVEILWGGLMGECRRRGLDHEAEYVRLRELYDAGHLRGLGWFVPNLLEYWSQFIEWVEATNAEHAAGCTNPECEWYVCRAARDLPPLGGPWS